MSTKSKSGRPLRSAALVTGKRAKASVSVTLLSHLNGGAENQARVQDQEVDEEDIGIVNTRLLEKSTEAEEYDRNRQFCRENGVVQNNPAGSSLAYSTHELRELQRFVSQGIISLLNKYEITQADGRPYVSSSPKGFLKHPDAWLAQHGYRFQGWPRGLPEKAVSVWPTAAILCVACMFVRDTIDLVPLAQGTRKNGKGQGPNSKAQTNGDKRKEKDRKVPKSSTLDTGEIEAETRANDANGKGKGNENGKARRREHIESDPDEGTGRHENDGSHSNDEHRASTKSSSRSSGESLQSDNETDEESETDSNLDDHHEDLNRSSSELPNDAHEVASASELEVEEELHILEASLRSRSVDSHVPKSDYSVTPKGAKDLSSTTNKVISSSKSSLPSKGKAFESKSNSTLLPKYSRKSKLEVSLAKARDGRLPGRSMASSSSLFPLPTDINSLLKQRLAGSDMSLREAEKLAGVLLSDSNSNGQLNAAIAILSKPTATNTQSLMNKRPRKESSSSDSDSGSDSDSSSSSTTSDESSSSEGESRSSSGVETTSRNRVQGRGGSKGKDTDSVEMSSHRDTSEKIAHKRKRSHSSRAPEGASLDWVPPTSVTRNKKAKLSRSNS